MKRIQHKLALCLSVFLMLSLLTACSRAGQTGSASIPDASTVSASGPDASTPPGTQPKLPDVLEQVRGNVLDYSFKRNKGTGWSVFRIKSRLANRSNVGIMEVKYALTLRDKHGEELDEIIWSWKGQDTPIAPNGGVEDLAEGQTELSGKVKQIDLRVLEVVTEEERPPIHVPKAGEYLYQALSDPHIQEIEQNPPTSIKLWIDRGGAMNEAEITDSAEIDRLVEAFRRIRIHGETEEFVTDNYNGIAMTFADGESCFISLNLTNLEYNLYGNSHLYELDDFGDFWSLMNELTATVEDGYR